MLKIRHDIPEGLLEVDATGLYDLLGGPTLIHLSGRNEDTLFVSVLLHGNETTGFRAVQSLLRDYQDKTLPRNLSLLIGNVEAAAQGMRRLDDQPDYNRIWMPGDLPEHAMVRTVLNEMRERSVFASIDVHNNTGLNPHYACVNHLNHDGLYLASLFSSTVVYFTRPEGVSSAAMTELGPAIVLECGQPGQSHGEAHAREYIEGCLRLDHIPGRDVPAQEFHLFHTVAIVKVPSGLGIGFGDTTSDIDFVEDLDHMNFRELPTGTVLGRFTADNRVWLDVQDEHGNDVMQRYFSIENGEIKTATPVMPSMLTLDARIIRQDCLCYLMERVTAEELQQRSSQD